MAIATLPTAGTRPRVLAPFAALLRRLYAVLRLLTGALSGAVREAHVVAPIGLVVAFFALQLLGMPGPAWAVAGVLGVYAGAVALRNR